MIIYAADHIWLIRQSIIVNYAANQLYLCSGSLIVQPIIIMQKIISNFAEDILHNGYTTNLINVIRGKLFSGI